MTSLTPANRDPAAALLFDLDGVLWDTTPFHAQAFARICEEGGLVAVDYDELAGRTTEEAWALILKANEHHLDAELLADLTGRKQRLARQLIAERPPLCAEIGRVATAAGSGWKMGLVTGASPATVDLFLAASGLAFDVVIAAGSTPRGKPDPAPYAAACRRLDVAPSLCWAIEDSRQGLESATAAGTRPVHLNNDPVSCWNMHPASVPCLPSVGAFLELVAEDRR